MLGHSPLASAPLAGSQEEALAAITGTLAATESGSDSASISGAVFVSGTLAATEAGNDNAAFTGSVLVSGTLDATEAGADVAAFAGTSEQPGITGTMDATETGSDTFASASQSQPITSSGRVGTSWNPNWAKPKEAKPRQKRREPETSAVAAVIESIRAAENDNPAPRAEIPVNPAIVNAIAGANAKQREFLRRQIEARRAQDMEDEAILLLLLAA